MNDMEKASQIGIPAYNAEQEEKRKLLDFLLSHYNDGRRKNLFCVAVNLLTIKEIDEAAKGEPMTETKQTSTTKTDRRPDCVTEIRMGNSVLTVSGFFKQGATDTTWGGGLYSGKSVKSASLWSVKSPFFV